MLKNLRCGECARLRCKAGAFDQLQIKCPRCGTLNHEGREPHLRSPRAIRPRRLSP
ncbi:Com family DNA-binding transcriptional regulator [Stenotrophomonas panacihumi]|uniref:Com family DNA-binding transcriptional regulator n=1 Tax=Stenotrophomonas panacihumi TaxID=676599 RepID=UPI000D3B363D|nr:Com family DNA-binding transcriptional regulator [Stenotrophomonas panacihumi]PTN55046.1 Com family DNA-binding transcriptional regulator [Stenotrophomonas panacihumi]